MQTSTRLKLSTLLLSATTVSCSALETARDAPEPIVQTVPERTVVSDRIAVEVLMDEFGAAKTGYAEAFMEYERAPTESELREFYFGPVRLQKRLLVLTLGDGAPTSARGKSVALAPASTLSYTWKIDRFVCGYAPVPEGMRLVSESPPQKLTTVPKDLLPDWCRSADQ